MRGRVDVLAAVFCWLAGGIIVAPDSQKDLTPALPPLDSRAHMGMHSMALCNSHRVEACVYTCPQHAS